MIDTNEIKKNIQMEKEKEKEQRLRAKIDEWQGY
jgi:hypothetical protein